MRPSTLRRGALAFVFAAVGPILAGCSSSPSTSAAPPASSTTTSVLTPAILTPTVTIGGHTYQVPTEVPNQSIDPSVASGGQIVLTNRGFLPWRLFAQTSQKITWTNLSSHPVRITILHLGIESSTIPVGGTFTYSSPTLVNFQYVSSSGYHGIVAIGAFP
jgi:hypothetical protein